MESEREAIGRIADILKRLEDETTDFAALCGYGTARGAPPVSREDMVKFFNDNNGHIQAIRAELRKIARDEDLIRRILG